ncbi:MAG: hypothetical protein KJZ92_17785 [Rhodocyclaceae bacterium]|nr:hypothetical protein [Rhodocyclaceae bacterium]
MKEVKLTKEQRAAAATLKEGEILFAYKDGSAIRMETEKGRDPYVWRNGGWRPMRG